MKKSIKKTVNYLKQYIGHEIIRTRPLHGDWSYTRDDPILLLGFTSDGCIKYRHTGFDAIALGNKEYVLDLHYTDRNWITYKKAIKAKNNQLNRWKGQKIRRIRPADNSISFMDKKDAPTLIAASKYHIVVMHNSVGIEGMKSTLDSRYNRLEDWEIAE